MKIGKNTSHYDTKKLHSMFCFIHKQISKHEGKMPWWDDLNIHIRKKSFSYSGRAYLDKPWSKEWGMFLSMSTDISVEQIAQLFAHELMHNYYKCPFLFCAITIGSRFYLSDEEIKKQGFYSLIWHFDIHPSDFIHFMIPLADVTEKDGPTFLHDQNAIPQNFLFPFLSLSIKLPLRI